MEIDIRQRIEQAISRHGLQKKDLAERMGKRKENLNTLITNPKWETVEAVCKALEIEPWQLFEDEIAAAGYRLAPDENSEMQQEALSDTQQDIPVGSQAGDGGGTPVQQPSADDALPFGGGQEAREDDVRRADAVSVARFECDCPHCGKGLKVSIEQA